MRQPGALLAIWTDPETGPFVKSPEGLPVVEVHGGGEGVSGVHYRADAGCKEGHSTSDIYLAAVVHPGRGGSVGFSWHTSVNH